MESKRIAYLEWLRVLATGAVVLMHTAAKKWYSVPVETAQWQILNLWDGLFRWPVPVFIMISGALFLGREFDGKKVWGRYIPRMVAAYVFWAAVYAYVSYRNGTAAEAALREFVNGHYHMWYLFFTCGLYLTVPFLQKVVESKPLTKQFLVLSYVFGILIPWVGKVVAAMAPEATQMWNLVANKVNYTFFLDHVFFFVLGWYLHDTQLSPKTPHILYAAGLGGVAVTIWGTSVLSLRQGTYCQFLYDFTAPNNVLAAAALFVFVKQHLSKLPRWVKWLSGCSFGIYLVHPLVIESLERAGVHVLSFQPLIAVPVLSAAVLAISWGVSAILRKLPVAGRYIT